MSFIDSHAHLHTSAFDEDREEALARARAAGVKDIVLIGAGGDLESTREAVRMAHSDPNLWASVGVHPHDVDGVTDESWQVITELAQDERVVGIGESGLDTFYDHGDPTRQEEYFIKSLELSRATGKPIICHIRDAHENAKRILREHGKGLGGVIHCFTGTAQDARDYVEMGYYISFSGIVTFKSADAIREAVGVVPRDKMLVETDCPYLAPVPKRGKRNEPAFLPHTAAVLAAECGVESAEIAEQTTANARRLFALT